MNLPHVGTFSILAFSTKPKQLGVATATGAMSVGERVPHAKPGVGVIATQAYTNLVYGAKGLELLAIGLTPRTALDRLLIEDVKREVRQVAIMDFEKRKAVFTGIRAPRWHGEIVGKDYIVIGNLLAGEQVLISMAEQFESSRGNLAWRLVDALQAGSESGGDRRGEKSTALVVVGTKNIEVTLKVDSHENPIQKLRSKLRALQQKK